MHITNRKNSTLSMPRSDLLPVLSRLGMRTNLKLCLDAGDAVSAPASATTWVDRSGGGFDFFRGTTSGADATDPTFNGTVGKSSSGEYWSFDGTEFFRYGTTNEAWMDNIHQDSAIFTIAAWVMFGSLGGNVTICGTRGTGSTIGFMFEKGSTDVLQLRIRNAGVVLSLDSTATLAEDVWNFCAVSLNEATGANGAILQINNTQQLFTSTYSSPSSSAAAFTMEIGAAGDAVTPLPNLSRMASIAMWEPRALSAGELRALFYATRGKFNV